MKLFFIILMALSSNLSWSEPLRCQNILSASETQLLNPESLALWSLQSPEIESKLSVTKKTSLKAIRNLVGRNIKIIDSRGHAIEYKVDFNKEHIYIDTYFDRIKKNDISNQKSMPLYSAGGLLRYRERWDKGSNDFDYHFAKGVYQAKGPSQESSALTDDGIFSRSEIPGKEVRSKKKSKNRKNNINEIDGDQAIDFARELIDFNGDFSPVLNVRQDRYFMKLTALSANQPSFYLSIDKVDFQALVAAKNQSKTCVIELELLDDLSQETEPTILLEKMNVFKGLTQYLIKEFSLSPAEDDKYEMGVQATIIP